MKMFLKFFVFVVFSAKFTIPLEFDDRNCDEQLDMFDEAFGKLELWALKWFDTWAKVPSGILHGNHQNPGHFTECVKFRHEKMQGQHCMLSSTFVDATNNFSGSHFDWSAIEMVAQERSIELGQGICLPAVCSPEKVVEYANKIFKEDNLKAFAAKCRTNNPFEVKIVDIFAFSVVGFLLAASLFSTIYEVRMMRQSTEPNKLLAAFSFYSHGAKLFHISDSNSPNVINCLNGLKTISIFWIIFGHRADDRWWLPVFNDISKTEQSLIYVIYTTYEKPVETFFVIGGLLATWSMMSALDKNTLNISRMYLHRYLRYTPTLAVLILFFISFTKFLGSGPFYNPPVEDCEKYWWSALLHVSVYTNAHATCYEVPWYLAVDFQLFLMSPILIYPLWRWGKKFFWFLPCLVVLTQVCMFATVWKYDISLYYHKMPTKELKDLWLRKFYYPAHHRLGPWVIGIMLGYIMYHTKGKKVKINKYLDAFLWVLSLGMMLYLVLIYYQFHQVIDNEISKFHNALHCACYRVLWSCAVAWIIFACQNGSGGIIRWFLSHKLWQPLGRMGLSIYLIHRIYQFITVFNTKRAIYWDFWEQTQKFYGDLLVTTFLAIIIYLTVENPVFVIEGYIHDKIRSKKSENDKIKNGNCKV